MHVMDSVTHLDMGLFQDGACPPPSAPSAVTLTLAPPPPPPLAPPPPPPPPPPLLPPPLLPGLGDPSTGLRRNKSVRKLFWKTIPEHQVKGRPNLWTQGPAEQHQIDVQTIEELFGHDNCQANSKAPPTRGGRGRTSFRETKEEVCILDAKRGMNIGIFLKQFKRSNQSIVEDIHSGNSEVYGAEPLRELLKLLPESDEVKKLKQFRGDVSKLSLADSFVYLLIQLPSYVARIESMLLKEEFPAECESMKLDIRTLRAAIRELMCCEELHAVLHLVLQAGNILNAGGYAGNAVGFKLSSLPSLAETKANKPGMNLLHFVALEAQKKDEKLLEFPLKLGHVQAASRISLETLDSDLQRLEARTRSIEENVQKDSELMQQLDTFLQSSTSSLCSLRGSRQQLKKESEELLDFFCEDKETFKLDDCFSIFTSFCLKFTAAVKENAERERKETARRRRLQELEEQKRHSWAAGEQFGGAFGFRSSSELDVHSGLSRNDEAGLLMELLMPKSHPRSPLLRRSGSLRRTRNSTDADFRVSESRETERKDSPTSLRVANEQNTSQNALNVASNYLRDNERQARTSTPTSDLNNIDGNEARSELKTDFSCKMTEKSSCNPGNMLVTVEKHTLVPELKAFDKVNAPTKSKTHNDAVVKDFYEESLEKTNERVESLVKTDKEVSDTVMVWCVTGVCEVDDAQSDSANVLAGNSTNQMPSKQQSANQNAVPISSQPQPSSRLLDIATEDKSTDNQETGTVSKVVQNESRGSQDVGMSTANQNVELSANVKEESQGPPLNEERMSLETVQNKLSEAETPKSHKKQSEKDVNIEPSGEKVAKKRTSQNSKLAANPKSENLSKKTPSSKIPHGSKSVRTLTTSESHDMRRVVPISRPTSAKISDKSPGTQRGASALSVPSRSASRRLERPSTAPSSRRSSFNKADTQEQDPNKKTAVKKTQEKKSQQEEKICKSTLRSMNQKEEREVASAPVTPIHRATPGFARNTASSSFRRTNTSREKSPSNKNVPSTQISTNTSPKILPKTSSPKVSPKLATESSRNGQNLVNIQEASTQNDGGLTSKITPPKILSPKLSSSLRIAKTLTNAAMRNSESDLKTSSPKMPSQNSNTNPHSPKTSSEYVQNPTITISDISSSQISEDQDDSTNLKNGNANINVTNDFSLSGCSNTSEKCEASSQNESPRKISTFYTKLSQSPTKRYVSSLNEQTVSSYSILTSRKSQFSTNSNVVSSEMASANESLNLNNNNLDVPQTSVRISSQMSDQTLQNSTNNNPDLSQDATISALLDVADAHSLENSTILAKSPKRSSQSLLSNSENASSQSKTLSPKASPRSNVSPSRLSPNNNSNLAQNSSPKSSKSLSRPGSFRSTSSNKSPDLGVKRSPPGVRRRNDSGNFSEKSIQSTKDSRPTWR